MTPPSYTPTDGALAVISVVMVLLDVLASYGVGPKLDPDTRHQLQASLTVLAAVGIGAFAAHRGAKHVALTIANAHVATAAAVVAAPPLVSPLSASGAATTPPMR